MARLLAIVEVDKTARVYCQAPCCNKTIYKRIHVLEVDDEILVLGSKCYSILYGNGESNTGLAFFTGTENRKLTQDERDLLSENTRMLIAQFENETRVAKNQHLVTMDLSRGNEIISPQYIELRDVKCTCCGCPTTTHLNFVPATGFKCDMCRTYLRPSPNRRDITKEMNAAANKSVSDEAKIGHEKDKASDSADAYRKASGK